MRIVAIANVKNESDIVEAAVRHNAAFVDRMVVLDNGSTDHTLQILRHLKNEGIKLEIVEDSSVGHWQGKRMTRLMKDYALNRYRADWIVPLDADEFILVKDEKAFRRTLAGHTQPLKIAWRTYVPDPNDDSNEINPALRICHRLVKEAAKFTKVLVPAGVLHRQATFQLSEGNHELLVNGIIMSGLELESIRLAHIPIRSPGQYGSKIAISRLQYMVMPGIHEDTGWHFNYPFELLKNDPKTFFDTYLDAALYYAAKPDSDFQPETMFDPMIYRGTSLRYTKMGSGDWQALQSIVKYAEALAKAYAELLSKYEEG